MEPYAFINIEGTTLCIGGVFEISQVLGCTKQQIFSLRKKPEFPKPIAHLAATPIWDIEDILAFKRTWVRRSGPKPLPEAVEVSE